MLGPRTDTGKREMRMIPSVAFVTKSYGPDRERCELLCRSVELFAPNTSHWIFVDARDHAAFRGLRTRGRGSSRPRAASPTHPLVQGLGHRQGHLPRRLDSADTRLMAAGSSSVPSKPLTRRDGFAGHASSHSRLSGAVHQSPPSARSGGFIMEPLEDQAAAGMLVGVLLQSLGCEWLPLSTVS
jgi:hypothetical protein